MKKQTILICGSGQSALSTAIAAKLASMGVDTVVSDKEIASDRAAMNIPIYPPLVFNEPFTPPLTRAQRRKKVKR